MEASCFKIYIPRITESLMHLLLEELELLDGKRRVLDALEVMIERVGEDVSRPTRPRAQIPNRPG